MSRPLRVLHCPSAVGGNPPALAREERNQGLDSRCVTFLGNPFGYPVDEDLASGKGRLERYAARFNLIRQSVACYDVVHFNFGTSLLPLAGADPSAGMIGHCRTRCWNALVAGLDLRLLRALGKTVFVTYQGDDARQGDRFAQLYGPELGREVGEGYYTTASDAMKRRGVALFDRYAQRIFHLNPDLAAVLPKRSRFMPYAHVDPQTWPVTPSSGPDPVILHAPSHRGVKGTRFVLEAVARLRQEGLRFDFRLVENLPHAEAVRLYAQADLLVDQLLIGWYGGLAVELMALGKPVVGHVRSSDLGQLPEAMRREIPITDATPASILAVLRRMIGLGCSGLRELGLRSRTYVERWHDPRPIVSGLVAEYQAVVGDSAAGDGR